MKRLFKEEAGTVVVLVTIAFIVLIGFVALVVDVGRLYLEYNKLAKAVDAAALAGAQEMPRNPDNVENIAREYVGRNGIDPGQVTVSVNGSNKEVVIEGTRNVLFTFAPIIGFHDGDVRAKAKAIVGAAASVIGAVPFAVEKQNFVFGQPYTLKYGANSDFDSDGDGIPNSSDPDDDNDGVLDEDDIDVSTGARTGWYGALSLGGTGASLYEENLKKGYNHVLKVGQILYTETGNVSGPTSDGVLYRLGECSHTPKCTVTSYDPACLSLVWVPVIIPVSSGNQVKQVKIVGFAAFLLEGVGGSGINNYVKGYFIQEATSGEVGNSSDGYGLMAVKLVE